MEKLFVLIKGEEHRIEEIDKDIKDSIFYQEEFEAKRMARQMIRMFDDLSDGKSHEAQFFNYCKNLQSYSFKGQSIEIRPYRNLYEAVLDGCCAGHDVGMRAMGMRSEEDGYLFAIRSAKTPEKPFGYVLYDANGEIITSRYAFNLEMENKAILKYIELFAKDILKTQILAQAI